MTELQFQSYQVISAPECHSRSLFFSRGLPHDKQLGPVDLTPMFILLEGVNIIYMLAWCLEENRVMARERHCMHICDFCETDGSCWTYVVLRLSKFNDQHTRTLQISLETPCFVVSKNVGCIPKCLPSWDSEYCVTIELDGERSDDKWAFFMGGE